MSFINSAQLILVYLANGVQGGAVVKAALARRFKVRAMVRDRARAGALAAMGAEVVEADLGDPTSLIHASEGAGHAVIQIPTGPIAEMERFMGHALTASRACGLVSVVLKLVSASRSAPCPEPSFVANARMEAMVGRSGLPFAIVRPTLYLDNLLKPSARQDIVRTGIFAPPIAASLPIAWTSADDCAEAALHLLADGVDGGDHRIAGPEGLTGEVFAARLSAGLERQIVYRAQPVEVFEREVAAAMGAETGRSIASKFRFFRDHPGEAEAILSRPFEPLPALRGFRPSKVEDWARRHRARFDDPSALSA